MDKASKLTVFLVVIVFGLLATVVAFAFTGPSQAPPNGDTSMWLLNGSNMYYSSGNLGIGTTNPSYLVDVEGGDAYASSSVTAGSSVCIGSTCWAQWQDVPAGAVMFFATSTCPSGWSEFTVARGRYVVGLPLGGTLATTTGTALSNLENRPVGQHSHGVNDPGHTHGGVTDYYGSGSDAGNGGDSYMAYGAANKGRGYTGITVNATGTVAGTNAPYIQYLICQKI